MNWYVHTTTSMYGPYHSWVIAYFFATINFGMNGCWVITHD